MVFVLGALLASPALTNLFGSVWLTVAFVAAVLLYSPEYFRRGIFNGHRQPLRLGVQIVAESAGRVLIAAVLLVLGWGVFGPALAIVLAPLIGVLAVRPAPVPPPEREGEPFSTGHALQFAAPVLACMAFAQALMNGGPILADLIGGTRAQVSLFAAALIFTRIPQYVLSPAIGALLPRASRVLSTEGQAAFERFVLRALGVVGLVGVLMVGGTWLLGEWGLRLFAGEEFIVEQGRARRAGGDGRLLPPLRDGEPGPLRPRTWKAGRARVVRRAARLRRLPCYARGRRGREGLLLAGRGTFAAAAMQAVFYLVLRRRAGA